MRDIPNLKRLWYCQQKYEKTTGCVCKKSGVCKCQSILNIPIAEIDVLRSEKRVAIQNQRRWKLVDIDYAKLESRFYQSRGMKEEMLRLAKSRLWRTKAEPDFRPSDFGRVCVPAPWATDEDQS